MFASMYTAYESLPDALKEKIEGREAVHSGKHIFGEGPDSYYNRTDAGGDEASAGRIGNSAVAESLSDPIHPLVITHPLSGKKALYVNPAFTREVVGLEKSESDALLSGPLYACVHWPRLPSSVSVGTRIDRHVGQSLDLALGAQ